MTQALDRVKRGVHRVFERPTGPLRWCVVATQPARPSREALEDQARRLLEHARRHSGASVEEMVKALGELQPRGAETRRSWYDWNEKPETVSLLTGLAAIQMLGPEGTMELLFGSPSSAEQGTSSTGPADQLEQLQTASPTRSLTLRPCTSGWRASLSRSSPSRVS